MIVLTGGAGFIGSCFLKKLNDVGYNNILVVDRLGESNKWKNLVGKRFNGFIHKDVFRKKLAEGAYNGTIESIVHLGACSSTLETNADYLFDNNLNYSIELAEYALRWNVKLIYASSAATYGAGELGYSDERFDDLKPLNCYGLTKHLFDLWAIDNGVDKKFTGLKFFNVFGPNEYHKGVMSSMAFKAYNQILETGKVKLFKSYDERYADGEQLRDFIYVKDAIETLYSFFTSPEAAGIYNVGTGKARSWKDLASGIFRAMDLEPDIEFIEMPERLKKQYQYFTQADTDKLKSAIGDYKFMTLEESTGDYVRNHLSTNNMHY